MLSTSGVQSLLAHSPDPRAGPDAVLMLRKLHLLRMAGASAPNLIRRMRICAADVRETRPELLVDMFNKQEDEMKKQEDRFTKHEDRFTKQEAKQEDRLADLRELLDEVKRDREEIKRLAWRELAKYRLMYCTRTIFQDLSYATMRTQHGTGGQVYKEVIKKVILARGDEGKLSRLSAGIYKQLVASDMFSTAKKGDPDLSFVQSLSKIYPEENENAHSRPEFMQLSPFNAPKDTGLCCGGMTSGKMIKHALVLASMQKHILNQGRTIEASFQNIAVMSVDLKNVVGYLANGKFTDFADVKKGKAEGNTEVDE